MNAQDSINYVTSQYQRKSISSLDQVIVLSDDYELIDPKQVKVKLDTYITLSRFDRNYLPASLSRLFLDDFYATSNHTVESLGNLVKHVYADSIYSLLSDPSIQKDRINQFKDKNIYTFEFGKGKSYSVTASDLEALFSSSFFYIPYIRDVQLDKKIYKKKVDDKVKKIKKLSVSVDAGIIWYQIRILPDERVQVNVIDTMEVRSYHHRNLDVYKKESPYIDGLLEACLDDIGHEFSFKIKHLSAFNLYGRIDSVNDNTLFLDLGYQEGVSLDDYFWIMQDYQSNNGVNAKSVGLTFVSQLNSDSETYRLSKATHVFGDKYHVGSWVKESPRKGVSFQVNLAYIDGFHLDERDSQVSSGSFYLNTVSSALGLDFSFSYLLSKSFLKSYLIQKKGEYNSLLSQLFFDINVGIAPVDVDYGTLVRSSDLNWTILSGVYMGFRKLFWLNRVAYQPFVYVGNNRFSISKEVVFLFVNEDDAEDSIFELNQNVLKYGISVEKMVSPYVLLHAAIFHCVGIGDVSKRYILNYDSSYSSIHEDNASYSHFGWYGFLFGIRAFF